ncbi:hypothetical protein [Sphingobium yanoikuyae]|nr:hypothetical protein [Sphingobium yanoikuyae]
MAVTGCGPVEVCQICLGNDPNQALSKEEVSRVYVYHNRETLPSLAKNIYYDEHCGIDCRAIVRFDVPSWQANEIAAKLSGQPIKPLNPNDVHNFLRDNNAGRSWWLQPKTEDLQGAVGDVGSGQLARVAILSQGATSRIYLVSWQM